MTDINDLGDQINTPIEGEYIISASENFKGMLTLPFQERHHLDFHRDLTLKELNILLSTMINFYPMNWEIDAMIRKGLDPSFFPTYQPKENK